jgi:hypothetical protein
MSASRMELDAGGSQGKSGNPKMILTDLLK